MRTYGAILTLESREIGQILVEAKTGQFRSNMNAVLAQHDLHIRSTQISSPDPKLQEENYRTVEEKGSKGF